MNDNDANSLQAKVETAKAIVDRLVDISTGFESDQWMEKFYAVKAALAEGRLRDTICEEARRTSLCSAAQWVVSRKLAGTLEEAMGVLCRQVHYPGHSEPPLQISELPNAVTELGTVADERERRSQAFANSSRSDPLDDDVRFAEILRTAEERAEAELGDDRIGFGYCHLFWERKKAILRTEFGLDWQTPAELNPHIRYD